MKLYITGMSIFVLAVFYLPLVFWALKRIWQSPRWHGIKKAGILMLVIILAYVIPLGDVTINSLAMAKVCPTAGLHIYKTVEVEGYLTNIGDGDILKSYPYRFIEATTPGGQLIHWERQSDGKILRQEIEQPRAKYELKSEKNIKMILPVQASRDVVVNRNTNEVLGEWKFFTHIPGWVDRYLVYRWFGSGGRKGCDGKPYDFYGFREAILIPKK